MLTETLQSPKTASVPVWERQKPLPFLSSSLQNDTIKVQSSLQENHAVLIKGEPGIGKSTLAHLLIRQFNETGIPCNYFNQPIDTPRQLEIALSRILNCSTESNDISNALQQLKNCGRYCILMLDHAAVDSADSVIEQLWQLCCQQHNLLGSIKLLLFRTNYLVVSTHQTPSYAFHHWVKTEIKLTGLDELEIAGFLHHLAVKEEVLSPGLEVGVEKHLHQLSKGNPEKLQSLLKPLLQRDVIFHKDLPSDPALQPQTGNKKTYTKLALAPLLLIFAALLTYLNSSSDEAKPSDADTAPVFANNNAIQEQISPPAISTEHHEEILPENSQQILIRSLERWLEAWQNGDLEGYSKSYLPDYSPAGLSMEQWQQQITEQFRTSPWQTITGEKVSNYRDLGQQVELELTIKLISRKGKLSYQNKRLLLSYQHNGWKIIKEESLNP